MESVLGGFAGARESDRQFSSVQWQDYCGTCLFFFESFYCRLRPFPLPCSSPTLGRAWPHIRVREGGRNSRGAAEARGTCLFIVHTGYAPGTVLYFQYNYLASDVASSLTSLLLYASEINSPIPEVLTKSHTVVFIKWLCPVIICIQVSPPARRLGLISYLWVLWWAVIRYTSGKWSGLAQGRRMPSTQWVLSKR